MSGRPSDFALSSVLTAGLGLLGLQVSSGGQAAERTAVLGAARGAEAVPESTPVVLAGCVVDADGTPVEGAVVASSAGGRASSDARGEYRLVIRVPLGAESLQVTAVRQTGGASRSASALVSIQGSTPAHSGPLVLQLGGACQPDWEPTFGEQPGVGTHNVYVAGVNCFTTFDDGSGPALYVGGGFPSAGGVEALHIAKWNGSSWSALGSGLISNVAALAVFDDGSGPALFAGGFFSSVGAVQLDHIAKWDGSSWSALGSGTNGNSVSALAVFDDGGGPALYAGGDFTTAGGVAASRIAKWDGSTWSPLGSGVSHHVRALVVHDDGSGPALYAGGLFLTAGGVTTSGVARWDGSSWSAVGGGMSGRIGGGIVPTGDALAVFDDGCGLGLYAGGDFELAADPGDGFLARWQGCLDTIPPTLACPPTLLVRDDPFDPPGEIVEFQVVAADPCHPAPPVVCVPPSGSTFPRGTTTVTCTATDAAGNQASCSFDVVVALPPRTRVR